MRRIVLLATAIFLIAVAIPKAQNIEYVGSTLWTGIQDVAVSGQYAYCAYRNGLVVIDVSNPALPQVFSKLYFPGEGVAIALSGDYAYLSDGTTGLKIIDISNPSQPTLISTYSPPGGIFKCIIVGNYAFASTNGFPGLSFLDISNPANPILVGNYLNITTHFYIDGSYIYLTSTGFLYIIDITDFSQPQLVGNIDLSGSCRALTVSGNYAYVMKRGASLNVIDVSNASTPTLVATLNMPDSPVNIAVRDSVAYVCLRGNGLQMVNIADPLHPTLMGRYITAGNATCTYLSGGLAFVVDVAYYSDELSGLRIINIANPNAPYLIGDIDCLDFITDVEIRGNYAFVANGLEGIQVLDIASGYNPISRYATKLEPVDITLNGNYIFSAEADSGLEIVDITDPFNPSLISSVDGWAFRTLICGDILYVVDFSTVHIMDISDINSPVLLSTYQTQARPSSIGQIYLNENYLYIPNFIRAQHSTLNHIDIVDVSNPVTPTLAGLYSTASGLGSGGATNIIVSGDYAYLVLDNLKVINVANPAQPFYTGYLDVAGLPNELQLSGNLIYLSEGEFGFETVDISNPDTLLIIAAIATQGVAHSIFADSNYIYVADKYSLEYFRFNPTEIEDEGKKPAPFSLSPAYPNPFNARTTIEYALPRASEVTLDIYDILGRKICRLEEGIREAGNHKAAWDAGDAPSGLYFYRLEAGDRALSGKMVLLK